MKNKYKETIPNLHSFVADYLRSISKSRRFSVSLVGRSKIILLASEGYRNVDIANQLGIGRKNVGRWRHRFLEALPLINSLAEDKDFKECRKVIREVLSDQKRSGRPKKFSEEDHNTVIAVACSNPSDHDWPLGFWDTRSLSMFLVEKKLVSDISHNTVSRILRANELRPHKLRYWIHSPDKKINPELFLTQTRACSYLLKNAQELYKRSVQIISIDEKPGIPVYTPIYPDYLPKPGKDRKREMFYSRNGKTDLIQAMNVAMGDLFVPHLNFQHKEDDFVKALKNCIDAQLLETPDDEIIIICDNFQTHKSEGVVRLIADYLNIPQKSLGIKLKSGILKNKKTREAFLIDLNHRIRFVFTPKHGSWLNPIECYFAILQKKLLKGFFAQSREEIETAISDFVNWYNEYSALPFNYKFSGFERKLTELENKLRPICLPPPKPPIEPPLNILPYGKDPILLPA